MKMIIAYIRPRMRDAVVDRLRTMKVPGASLTEVDGFGLEAVGGAPADYGAESAPYVRVVKVEIVCADAQAEAVAAGVAEAARTGRRGDGKVFVVPVHQALDVRTRATGDDAFGGAG